MKRQSLVQEATGAGSIGARWNLGRWSSIRKQKADLEAMATEGFGEVHDAG
jgi:hypothetical protein